MSVEAYKNWSPAAQQAAKARLSAATNDGWRPFFCAHPGRTCDGRPHGAVTWNHARRDQWPPPDKAWTVWLMMSGRGAGKTRCGAEYTHEMADRVPRIALIAATGADVRDVMVDGESGLLRIARPGNRPIYEPSKRRLTWPNGCVATTFSAEEPDRLRGPEHGYAWVDEACHYSDVQAVWDNLLFGLRIGARPRIAVTTTPKPRRWLSELIAHSRTRLTTATTYDNLDNLAPTFAEAVIARYENTRLGRQELYGEILADVEGALWHFELIETTRVDGYPALGRIVVAIDPPGTRAGDEAGIVAAGAAGDDFYVLADRSGHYSPHGWATAAIELAATYSADAIVAETNFGAEMVTHTLRTAAYEGRLITVRARRGKDLRAEPVVGLWEQGRAHIVGAMPELEAQMTGWVPYSRGGESPDRLDAMVYAVSVLALTPGRATLASPVHLDVVTATIAGEAEASTRRHPAMRALG